MASGSAESGGGELGPSAWDDSPSEASKIASSPPKRRET
ncbi:hypothetical protein PF008_g26022 [Phytophthora fragariae]|uniref:Uncharacterized protein n=1 Tax=Phytophthora fragariae TaxID=53985 RepID=A0A6G0QI95_9STRA|nr:hypothetical protein PF003_g39868 [Phytophthora fragariae]KAE9288872.1 hypothetical protein PF008_g26022 [Phytophthora fragariae]